MTVEIRGLHGPEDLRGTIRIHDRAWRAAYGHLLAGDGVEPTTGDPADEDVQEWADRIGEDGDGFLVAVDDGTVRGYAYFRWGGDTKDFVGPDEAGLTEIYVDPTHWDRGIGTRLLEHGIGRLPDGIRRLKLEVLADNDVGRGFYEARGFERVAEGEIEIGGEPYPTAIYALAVGGSDFG